MNKTRSLLLCFTVAFSVEIISYKIVEVFIYPFDNLLSSILYSIAAFVMFRIYFIHKELLILPLVVFNAFYSVLLLFVVNPMFFDEMRGLIWDNSLSYHNLWRVAEMLIILKIIWGTICGGIFNIFNISIRNCLTVCCNTFYFNINWFKK
jgi:hypothetical protein